MDAGPRPLPASARTPETARARRDRRSPCRRNAVGNACRPAPRHRPAPSSTDEKPSLARRLRRSCRPRHGKAGRASAAISSFGAWRTALALVTATATASSGTQPGIDRQRRRLGQRQQDRLKTHAPAAAAPCATRPVPAASPGRGRTFSPSRRRSSSPALARTVSRGLIADAGGILGLALGRSTVVRLRAIGREDQAAKDKLSPSITAWPAIGVRQEPSSAARKARSQASACPVGTSWIAASIASTRASPMRLSMQIAPWPGAGGKSVERHQVGDDMLEPQPLQPGIGEDACRRRRLRRACAAASAHCRETSPRRDPAACGGSAPGAAATTSRPWRRAAVRRSSAPPCR